MSRWLGRLAGAVFAVGALAYIASFPALIGRGAAFAVDFVLALVTGVLAFAFAMVLLWPLTVMVVYGVWWWRSRRGRA